MRNNISALWHLNNCSFDPFPHHLAGDEILPLGTWLMRCYPGQISEEQRMLHYRLTRARKVMPKSNLVSGNWSGEKITHSPPYSNENQNIFLISNFLVNRISGNESFFFFFFASQKIANTFGIFAARWSMYHFTIIALTENAESYVLAAIALHNYLRLIDNAVHTPVNFVNSQEGIKNQNKTRHLCDLFSKFRTICLVKT